MPTLRVREQRDLHYRDLGDGEPILFLHAFPLHAGIWEPQFQALSVGWRLIALDAPGFGESTLGPDPLTMETIAGDADALLGALGIARAVIVGLSMGGYAALALFRRHPERVRALVLADTRATADSAEGKKGRVAFAKGALEHGPRWVASEMLPKLVRAEPARDRAVATEVARMMEQADPRAVAAASLGMGLRPDSTDLLARIDRPTLVLVGEEDVVTPPADARRMADAIPGAKLVEIAGAAHLSSVENPADFNGALQDFLRALPHHSVG